MRGSDAEGAAGAPATIPRTRTLATRTLQASSRRPQPKSKAKNWGWASCELKLRCGRGGGGGELVRIQTGVRWRWCAVERDYKDAGGRRDDNPISVARAITEDFEDYLA